MSKVRVVRVITRLNIGGPARHVTILSRGLDPRRFDTTLFTGVAPAVEGTLSPGKDVAMAQVLGLRREPTIIRDIVPFLWLWRRFRRLRPQIVHTHMTNAGFVGRLAAFAARVPIRVHTYHGHVLAGYIGRFLTWTLLSVERFLARVTDVLVAVSPEVRDELLLRKVGRPDQWRVVRLGLDLDPLLQSNISPAEARKAIGIPPQGTAVGIVGRLAPIKDHATFIAAARRLAAKREITFVIAGDGELRRQLEAEAADLGRSVQFLGWVTDLPNLYAALDVVVLTSRNEGTPVALIEAMAAARPVVATRVGGVPDCVPSDVGRLVDARDVQAVADAIEWFIDHPAEGAEAGRRGRQWVKKRYSAERLVEDIAHLYEELLARKGLISHPSSVITE